RVARPPAAVHDCAAADDDVVGRGRLRGERRCRREHESSEPPHRSYFQCRCLPAAIQSIAVATRRAFVSGRFASPVHSMDLRLLLGLTASNAAFALALFFSPAASSAGTRNGFFAAAAPRSFLMPCSFRAAAFLITRASAAFAGRSDTGRLHLIVSSQP